MLGGDKRDRTADLLHAMQALSQLSYTPKRTLVPRLTPECCPWCVYSEETGLCTKSGTNASRASRRPRCGRANSGHRRTRRCPRAPDRDSARPHRQMPGAQASALNASARARIRAQVCVLLVRRLPPPRCRWQSPIRAVRNRRVRNAGSGCSAALPSSGRRGGRRPPPCLATAVRLRSAGRAGKQSP